MSLWLMTYLQNKPTPIVILTITIGSTGIVGCHFSPKLPIAQSSVTDTETFKQCEKPESNRFAVEENLGDFSSQPDDSYVQNPESYFDISVGGGVIVADFNGDMRPDIFIPTHGQDLLYLNQGKRRFRLASDWMPSNGDITYSVGGSAADYDGDGDLDLYLVTAFGSDRLYQNTGHSFEDVSLEVGISQSDGDSTAAVWFDYDLDGDLDVFIAGHKEDSFSEDQFPQATANTLYQNANGEFEKVDLVDEATEPFTYAAAWIQTSQGSRPWLYKVNDFGYEVVPNRIYDNTEAGFSLITGTGLDQPMYGMGIAQADLNGDQIPDFLMSDFERVQLFLSEGDEMWYETAHASGLDINKEENFFSWGVNIFDFDNDSDLDVFAGWGPVSNHGEGISTDDSLVQPNTYWLNNEDGFQNISSEWQLVDASISRGSAVADLDQDGLLDLVIGNINAPAEIRWGRCMNGKWVSIQLSQTTLNRFGVGSVISLDTEHGRQSRWIIAGDSFASGGPPVAHFGLGETELEQITIEVTLPDGTQSSHQIAVNQHTTVTLD